MFAVAVFGRSLFALIENSRDLFRISAFWVPAMVICVLPFTISSGSIEPQSGEMIPWVFSQVWYVSVPIGVLTIVVAILGSAITAIAWHRLLILGERQESILVWPKNWAIQRYFVNGLALYMVPFIATVVFGIFFATQQAEAGEEIFQTVGFAGFRDTLLINLVILLFFLIWGLKLPAIATAAKSPSGDKFRFRDSWKIVKSRLLDVLSLVIVLAIASALFTSVQTSLIPPGLATDLSSLLASLFSDFVSYVFVFVTVGVLSELYKELTPEEWRSFD